LAVTGNPVLHSKSPCMFNELFSRNETPATYFRLAANSAKEAVILMRALNLRGMNVTAPFKEDIMACVDEVDHEARLIGGVNTVVNDNGKLTGYNTDHFGVAQSLLDAGEILQGRKCVVIGAGGAGKAAAYGLMKRGAHVTIVNRTVDKAREAAAKFNCQFAGMDQLQEVLQAADIVVFSLAQNINPVEPGWLLPRHVIFDANYKSSEFSGAARQKGCKIIEGLDWLLNQAVPAYMHYFGVMPDAAVMKAGLSTYNLNDKRDKIAMIGFMGSGKTTTGKKLAKTMGYSFVDTDDLVVEQEKMSIPDIFREKGEEYFRDAEREVLQRIIQSEGKQVISCGGGLVLNDENRALLTKYCLVLWLYASPEAIVKRIKPGTRPLLNVENPVEKATELFEQRKFTYASATDMLVNTEIFRSEDIAQKIHEEISKTFGN